MKTIKVSKENHAWLKSLVGKPGWKSLIGKDIIFDDIVSAVRKRIERARDWKRASNGFIIESGGKWPGCIIPNVYRARKMIVGFFDHDTSVFIHVSPKNATMLDQDIPFTRVSYRDAFENNSIGTILIDSDLDDSTILVSHEEKNVQIEEVAE